MRLDAIYCVAFLFLLLAGRNALSSSLDYRPDLYFDGNQFAERMFAEICDDQRIFDLSKYKPDPIAPIRGHFGLQYKEIQEVDIKSLRDWMLAQPDNSIYPHVLLKKAIQLSTGNIDKGLKTVWNLLSADWSDKKKAVQNPWYLKLVDITGEKKIVQELYKSGPSGVFRIGPAVNMTGKVASRGGNYSAWYHMAGTSTISFGETFSNYNLQPFTSISCGTADAFTKFGKFSTDLMLFLEHRSNRRNFVDYQKRENIDRAGASFGSQLAKHLILGKNNPSYCKTIQSRQPIEYLVDRPDIYGPQWHLKPGQMPFDYLKPGQ